MKLREASRQHFNQSQYPASHADIQTGALQRIADATELLAKRYQSLLNDMEYWKRMHDRKADVCKRLERQNASLRGVITRMKRAK